MRKDKVFLKAKVWTVQVDNGDGTVSTHYFATKPAAEAFHKYEESKDYYQGFGDDSIDYHTFEFDENGVLLNPDKIYE